MEAVRVSVIHLIGFLVWPASPRLYIIKKSATIGEFFFFFLCENNIKFLESTNSLILMGCSLGYMNIYRTQIIKKENKGACM